MNTPKKGITDEVQGLAKEQIGKVVSDKVAKVKEIATEKGLGGAFDIIEGIAEKQTGIDLNDNGKIGG